MRGRWIEWRVIITLQGTTFYEFIYEARISRPEEVWDVEART